MRPNTTSGKWAKADWDERRKKGCGEKSKWGGGGVGPTVVGREIKSPGT